MEHLAETMTDFLLRRKYITEEQTEWCHYIFVLYYLCSFS